MKHLRAAHLLAPCLVAASLFQATPTAARVQPPAPIAISSPDLVTPTMVVARLASVFDVPIIPRGVVDTLVRWRLGVRDLAHETISRLATLAQYAAFTLPDLTILTTQPVADSTTTWATSGFGWRDDPIRHRRKFHRGADIRARPGTPVVAAGDGVVTFAGRQGGYGNIIYVDHGGGVVTRYAHLRRIEVKRDATITAGQRIGQVGSTGRTTGPHLHFEVRLDGRAVDPWTALMVAELRRELPAAGQVAAFALAPELQELAMSDLDPPRRSKKAKRPAPGPRPDRPGRVKRPRPVS